MKKEITLETKNIYKGRVISLNVKTVECPNGVISTREVVTHPGGVCVLAEIDGKIILEKQYRSPYDDFILELPAGKLNPGEDPKEAAIRELEEEVGYKAEDLISVGCMYPSVGYTDEIIHLYVAKNLTKTNTCFDDDEDLETVFIEKAKIKEMLVKNEIKDAKTLILLYKYFAM